MMTKFELVPVRADEHAELIRSFWRRYLSVTPMGRLEWLERNPAGPAIWVFARDRSSGEVAGMIAVTRKEILSGGRPVAVGIMGDLMVGEQYRVFGPSLQLVKTAVTAARDAGVSWIYTVPNPDSLKLVERAGFKQVATLVQLVRPVRTGRYLERRLPSALANVAGSVLDRMLDAIARDSYGGHGYRIRDLDDRDPDLASLADGWRSGMSAISSASSGRYLAWRYLENPMYPFRLLGAWHGESGRLAGVLPYARTGDVLRIYDIVTGDPGSLYPLLRALRSRARQEDCKSIEIAVTRTNPWRHRLRVCGFLDSRADVAIYATGSDAAAFDSWAFFGGDRNI